MGITGAGIKAEVESKAVDAVTDLAGEDREGSWVDVSGIRRQVGDGNWKMRSS